MLTTSDEPLSLTPITRSFVADSITPISAYLALAQPGRSCLLESVEGTERIRGIIGRYRLDRADLPFPGGAVWVFSYDAARVLEPVGEAPPTDVRFSDALILVPGTWLVFDHFTHRLTLIGLCSANDRAAVEARLDAYVARLLDQRPTIPGAVRADGPVTASMDEPTLLNRDAQAKEVIRDGE